MLSAVPHVTVLGVRVAAIRAGEALAETAQLVERGRRGLVFYANAHTLNLAQKDPTFRRALEGRRTCRS